MAKVWIATVLNFFLLGLGTLIFTKKKIQGLFLTLGALLCTYVEQFLLTPDMAAFKFMFAGFFLLAIGCAYDGFVETKAAMSAGAAAAPAKAA